MPFQPFQATRDFTKASIISQVDEVEAACGRLRETIIEVDRLLQGEETVVFAVRDRAESRQFEPSLILPWRFSLGGGRSSHGGVCQIVAWLALGGLYPVGSANSGPDWRALNSARVLRIHVAAQENAARTRRAQRWRPPSAGKPLRAAGAGCCSG